MSRTTLAFLIGAVGFVGYIVAVVTIGDFFVRQHWAVQLVYYVTAGIVWVFPARRLMLWGAAGRRG
ncbi:DUF2842 domain-containing protein [Rubritepida flocculans]|jgi:hypothetical protein|uniref:DUF2842 domain-containing protein n=1 Tax=Rubritepida flocculans TaxID=182403 RepID=UPI0004249384|nr:DUF2842 domain-containing protein [Rubritepida flocculans]